MPNEHVQMLDKSPVAHSGFSGAAVSVNKQKCTYTDV